MVFIVWKNKSKSSERESVIPQVSEAKFESNFFTLSTLARSWSTCKNNESSDYIRLLRSNILGRGKKKVHP